MVVVDLKLDNVYSFNNFEINFSYPKKLLKNRIKEEYLKDRPNFRYKKVNIILGSNATGKTSLGKAMMNIFNFLTNRDYKFLDNMHSDKERELKFSIDFIPPKINAIDEKIKLYRVVVGYFNKEINIDIYSSDISKLDTYEKAERKLSKINFELENDLNCLKKINAGGWLFEFPDINFVNKIDLKVLNAVLKTVDNTIIEVIKSKEVDETYIIKFKNRDVVIQNKKVIDNSTLSSGTENAINIASIISSIKDNVNGFYYCDEKFSYINSEIEIALLGLMVELLHSDDQLFFTTHNLDVLDIGLPNHSYMFLNKEKEIKCTKIEEYVKKNDVNLKNLIKNNVFDFSPDLQYIYDLEVDLKNEK